MIQYRLGAFGFLSSEGVHKYGKTNVGLLDMRFALEWVQEHIGKFGGNSSHVTIAGESSGAGSVVLQSMAYGGREDHLFNNVSHTCHDIRGSTTNLHRLLPPARIPRPCISMMVKCRQITIDILRHEQGVTVGVIYPRQPYLTVWSMLTPILCNTPVQMSPFQEHGVLGLSNLSSMVTSFRSCRPSNCSRRK